jgi:hypothetical protein
MEMDWGLGKNTQFWTNISGGSSPNPPDRLADFEISIFCYE